MYSIWTRWGWRGRRIIGKFDYRCLTKSTEPLRALEPKQKHLEFVNDDLIPDSESQTRASTLLPIESKRKETKQQLFEISERKQSLMRTRVDKSPVGFEDIPGPAVLKILEKYWKYVPIIGTQVIWSLLGNNFTLGRLTWNRNITPLKYLFNEYGPIVRINGPIIGDIVMIHRPEHVAQVFKQEGDNPIRSGIDVLQHYRLNYRKNRLPGPFSMEGNDWLETRTRLEKPFAEQISRYLTRLDETCDEFVQKIRRIRNRQDEMPEKFDEEFSRWGMECFAIFIFNKRLGFIDNEGSRSSDETARIVDAVKQAHNYLSKCETGFQVWRFFQTPYSRKLFESCDVIDGLIGKHIRQAQNHLRAKSSGKNEISDFDVDESSPIIEKLLTNQRMHPDDVSALLMDMIILGVQATVNSQAFLLYFLAKNPRIQRKLYEEISTITERNSSLNEEILEQMTYLKACLRECLRLRPAFPYISRILPNTINLHGYTIPKGTCLIMANEISSRREENFDDPDKFLPERWLNENSYDDTWQKFSCLPFGHGVRSCLGKNMAEKKIMLLTAKLIREFRIEYDYAEIGSKNLMVNVPNRPLKFRFVDRNDNL